VIVATPGQRRALSLMAEREDGTVPTMTMVEHYGYEWSILNSLIQAGWVKYDGWHGQWKITDEGRREMSKEA